MEIKPEEFEKKINSAMDNISKMRDKISNDLDKSMPFLKKMGEEQYKINSPLERKVVNLHGKDVIVSLISDGRVVVDFQNIDIAKTYYQSLNDNNK